MSEPVTEPGSVENILDGIMDPKEEASTKVEVEDTNSRTLRSSEDRESTQRDQPWKPARLLPTPNPVKGIDFRYVRIASQGSIDNTNHSQALRDQWEPALASEHKELGVILSDRGASDGEIILGGMMLMKRPSHIGDAIKAQIVQESRDQIAGVDGSYLSDQNSSMRKFSEKSSKITFGG